MSEKVWFILFIITQVASVVVKMNGKMHSDTTFSADGMRAQILNPFVHKLELDSTYDKIRVNKMFLQQYIMCLQYFLLDFKNKNHR